MEFITELQIPKNWIFQALVILRKIDFGNSSQYHPAGAVLLQADFTISKIPSRSRKS